VDKFKLVVFDLEGTLVKHTTRQAKIVENSISKNGVTLSINVEENYSLRSKPEYHSAKDFIKKILELNNTPKEDEEIDKMVKFYKELRQNPEYLFDLQYLFTGVKEILAKLVEKEIICVLLTNANALQNQFLLEKFEIKKYFDFIVDDSCGLADKPDPTRVNLILEKFSIIPEEVLIVDDSLAGLLAGKNAKTRTCGVLTGNSTKEMFEKEGIDYIFESVKDLGEVL
jgi:HAD superfamily hydrolase (TIGR01509 family)